VKFLGLARTCCNFIAALVVLLNFAALGQTKEIRLRKAVITTTPPARIAAVTQSQAQPGSVQAPASGLYLIQFQGHIKPTERAKLRAMGVKFFTYVPDDAFIVKFNNVSLAAVRALNFIQWVGPYQPDYKIDSQLSAAANAALSKNQNPFANVNVLISPGATPAEIANVKSQLASVKHESDLRLGTILRGRLNLANLPALAQSDSVLWIEPAPNWKLLDEQASKLVGGDDGNVGTPTVTEQMGFDGKGVIVCVADTGLDTGDTNTMHPDLRGRVTGFKFYGTNIFDGSDGYGHGTHVAGIVAGDAATGETDPDSGALYGLGVASGADLFIERIFDDDANEASPFPSDATLTEDAVRAGAEIGVNSWGNDVQGAYDADAAEFDELVRDADPVTPGDQPYILEFSAGNAGPDSETLDSPATAKNVIAVGACENVPNTLAETYGLYDDGPDTVADFSSRGPCQDGRIKPDLVAPGTWIASCASSSAPDEASIAWSVIDNYYVYMGGTSMSGPFAGGAAADFVQYYKSLHTNAVPSPALVKAALINSAVELNEADGGPGPIPNNDEGWGRIDLTNIIVTNLDTAPRYYQFLDQTVLLSTGQTYTQHALVRSSDQPLKITLAYTDVPGFPGAIPALVNNLDLEVIAPDGTLYRGNEFSGGESVPNPTASDNINNVKGIYLSKPMPGDYLVRVIARNVPEDARLDTAAIDQDFALVVSGDLARPRGGVILLDRTNYTAPGVINLEVFDVARAASNAVSVLLKSTTEPTGETFTLNAAGNYGAFTGAVATVIGPATVDGKLEVHNGDAIEADYVDSSGSLRTASATVDVIPPVISNVAVETNAGVITITWQTSEPADSVIYYGTSQNFNLAVTNSALATDHSVTLARLAAGQTYYFEVSSSDPAGNTTTDNNGGNYFSFVAVPTPTVLLVDDYDTAAEQNDGSPVIPDSAYTNALAASGFSYSFWKVTERGSPTLADLQPFQVVIWRTTDDLINYGYTDDGLPDPSATNNTLSVQQQTMIQDYLNDGGSFFMASMNILEELGDVPFRRDVLQVGGFETNPDPPAPCQDCDEDYGVPAAFGAANNPISSGMYLNLDYSNYPSFDLDEDYTLGPDFSDTFTPATNATPIFFESSSGKTCGVSYPPVGQDSPGRVVFLSFPLDAVPANTAAPNNEVVLLRNILSFLAPGANGVGTITLDKTIYTIPDRVTVEVGDSDLIGAGQTQVTFTSSSSTNSVTVTLNETTHPGLFRGYIALAAANSAASNQLAVANGGTITATYFDASRHTNVTATAAVDTIPPVISQVSATTSVGSAVVSWTTSKPADSLVQYGQSTLLGQTAYAAQLTTNHVVTVSGLLPDRNYYYQVVSRDEAGNTAVDDNNGTLYTFSTVPVPRPPWFDNLESGAPGWTVVPDPVYGSDINWTLGTPDNGLQTSAHSGTNCWGSDLDGEQIPLLASSYLLSPEIDLSGLSQATLTFWDCFDFSSGLEEGEVLVSTNNGADLSSLPVLYDFSGDAADDWEQETFDLTPYVGQTIQVVWYYAGVSVGSPTYGWLVDDVGITGVSAGESGTIVINKNLGQGSFTLNGPINETGTAPMTIITNAPPGQYVVTFSDVPFYQTPFSETNTLAPGGMLNFTGNYSFIDENNNGISDAWELYYFGALRTNVTQTIDVNGMTDYENFIAGLNPTNPASQFIFVSSTIQTNRAFQLQWSVQPGRLYQLDSSTNLGAWTTVTGWQQATVSPMTYLGTNVVSGSQFFRVEVRP
jgi:Subtilase family